MRAILSLPLFLSLPILANVLMLGRAPGAPSVINAILFELPLPSGRGVPITVGDALILTAIAFLYLETSRRRAHRLSRSSIIACRFSCSSSSSSSSWSYHRWATPRSSY